MLPGNCADSLFLFYLIGGESAGLRGPVILINWYSNWVLRFFRFAGSRFPEEAESRLLRGSSASGLGIDCQTACAAPLFKQAGDPVFSVVPYISL